MTNRQTPPGRTSLLNVVVVKPFGPHHLSRCCGSVHILKTSSRGASNTRVAAISRSPTRVAGLFWSLMGAPLRTSRSRRPDFDSAVGQSSKREQPAQARLAEQEPEPRNRAEDRRGGESPPGPPPGRGRRAPPASRGSKTAPGG